MREFESKKAALKVALLSGNTVAKAAQVAGISEATAYRYLGDHDFKQQLVAAESIILETLTRRLLERAESAIDELSRLVVGRLVDWDADGKPHLRGGVGASARVSAARSLLDALFKGRELTTLERRLAELETLVKESFSNDESA